MVSRIVTVASLALLLGTGCGPSESGSPQGPSTAENGQQDNTPSLTYDQVNDETARLAPEFSGLYGESGRLVVAAVDISGEAQVRLRAAVESQHGVPPGADIEFRLVEYSWKELAAWRWVMKDVGPAAPSFSALDANEFLNRVVVGLSDMSQEAAVRQYAESEGVPREALVVEHSEPIRLWGPR